MNVPSHSKYIFNKPISGVEKENMLNNVIRQELGDLMHSEFDKIFGGLNVQIFYDVVGEWETVEG